MNCNQAVRPLQGFRTWVLFWRSAATPRWPYRWTDGSSRAAGLGGETVRHYFIKSVIYREQRETFVCEKRSDLKTDSVCVNVN